MKANDLLYLFLSLFLLQSCDSTPIEKTIAFSSKDEVWEDFRHKFPFHLQTIGITDIEEDESFQLIISEPPPHVSQYDIAKFFSDYKHKLAIHNHKLGVDGWVRDISIVLDGLSEDDIKNLINELSELLFHTSFKAFTLDLSKSHLDSTKADLNYQISAAELENWLMVKKEKFHPLNDEHKQLSISKILGNSERGVFLQCSPRFCNMVNTTK